MKLILIFCLVLTCILTLGAKPQQQTIWEYKFVYQCDDKKANAWAIEGWEMTALSAGICVFKKAR